MKSVLASLYELPYSRQILFWSIVTAGCIALAIISGLFHFDLGVIITGVLCGFSLFGWFVSYLKHKNMM